MTYTDTDITDDLSALFDDEEDFLYEEEDHDADEEALISSWEYEDRMQNLMDGAWANDCNWNRDDASWG